MDLGHTQHLIVQALETGEDEDRCDLLEYLRPRLVLWATSRLSPALRAKLEPDDIAQETLLAVHKSIGNFQGTNHKAFLGWVFKIAENRIRDQADHFGALKRQKIVPMTFSQTSPSTVVARIEEVEQIAAALTQLTPDYAEVIRLRRFEELDVAEIAELKGKSPNAIRILYCRALKALIAALAQDEEAA